MRVAKHSIVSMPRRKPHCLVLMNLILSNNQSGSLEYVQLVSKK